MKKVKVAAILMSLLVAGSFVGCGGGSDSDGVEISGSVDQCSLVYTSRSPERIVQGTRCVNENSPVVLVSVAPPNDFADVCTGTLLTANAVLTAGHCTPLSPQGVSVSTNGETIAVSRVLVHPSFRIDDSQNLIFDDVALLILSHPVSNKTLPIITSRIPSIGEPIAVYGFGLNEEGVQGVFRSGLMTITGLTPTHISAAFDGTDSNTCGGDSGGPAVQRFRDSEGNLVTGIVGILSSGLDRQCRAGDVSSFTYLNQPQILKFIRDNVPNTGQI